MFQTFCFSRASLSRSTFDFGTITSFTISRRNKFAKFLPPSLVFHKESVGCNFVLNLHFVSRRASPALPGGEGSIGCRSLFFPFNHCNKHRSLLFSQYLLVALMTYFAISVRSITSFYTRFAITIIEILTIKSRDVFIYIISYFDALLFVFIRMISCWRCALVIAFICLSFSNTGIQQWLYT
jgi:hypothetical protein